MKRLAFTIIYNGLHHLKHKGYWQFMRDNFDAWVVVEGHAKPGGSTFWCNNLDIPVRSTDGTHEFMEEVARENPNIIYHSPGKYWASKDEQVNKCMELLRKTHSSALLWQVDADEHFTLEDIQRAEQELLASPHNVMSFQFNHFVGENMVAVGQWGSQRVNRLWKWKGEKFTRHEPAMISGQTIEERTDIKFDHYSYYFLQDVEFKEKYYKGYEGITKKWKALQQNRRFPVSIMALLPRNNIYGRSNTHICLLHKATNQAAA